jgi:hypothetical protein
MKLTDLIYAVWDPKPETIPLSYRPVPDIA